jgi:hypothetical protein
MIRLATLLVALSLVVGCAHSRIGRYDSYINAATSFLITAKTDQVTAIQKFASPNSALLLKGFLSDHIDAISQSAIYGSMVIDGTGNPVVLRVECCRHFTDAERAAEEQRVRNTCLAIELGVVVAVYEFTVSEDKRVVYVKPVNALWP